MTWLYSVWFAHRRIIWGSAVVGAARLVFVTATVQGEYRVMPLAPIWLSLGVGKSDGLRWTVKALAGVLVTLVAVGTAFDFVALALR